MDFWIPFIPNQLKWEHRTKLFISSLIESSDPDDRDVAAIAGDISHFNIQTLWVISTFAKYYNKVLLVMGNHDFYLVSNNQANKYKNNSLNRVKEIEAELLSHPRFNNVHLLKDDKVVTYKGVKFAGLTMWYPLQTVEQQIFFQNVSNDSVYIKGVDINELHRKDQENYEKLLTKDVDVMLSHIPVINIDSHYKFNSTACYLTPLNGLNVKHWVFGHSHEQKVYEKPYCNFYMNAIGYPVEQLELSIKSFSI